MGLSASRTPQTDFDGMAWPQVLRGVAIMFCLLPQTRPASGHLDPARVPDASGLFNPMRNLGGAIGLALIDTVIWSRGPVHAADLAARLAVGDATVAQAIGVPAALVAQGPPDAGVSAMLAPLIEKAALTLLAVLCLPFARPARGVRP